MKEVIFIVGPTAAGKSAAAFLLAKKLKAEIISCDSMLIYKEPRIITNKPPQTYLKQVRHHFLSKVSVTQEYNVVDYFRLASKKIIALHRRHRPVIVCGGSGLYVKALLDGIFEHPGKDPALRRRLQIQARKQGWGALYSQLAQVDPDTAQKISPNDSRRIIRALEVYHLSGTPFSRRKKEAVGLYGKLPLQIFGLTLPRPQLYDKINARAVLMFERGAIAEVKDLRRRKLSLTAQKIIGLPEISAFLDGHISKQEALELMQRNTRRYAKRQLTWFNADKRIHWISVEGLSFLQIKDDILNRLYVRNN